MSLTLIGNYIQLASHVLVLFGFREFTSEESNAIIIVIGLVGELAGFVTTHIGRVRMGGVSLLGFKRY